jgi:hypothetical protein
MRRVALAELGERHDDGQRVVDPVLEDPKLLQQVLEVFASHVEIGIGHGNNSGDEAVDVVCWTIHAQVENGSPNYQNHRCSPA